MAKKLKVSLKPQPALTATRVSVGTERMVYALVASKMLNTHTGNRKLHTSGPPKKEFSESPKASRFGPIASWVCMEFTHLKRGS